MKQRSPEPNMLPCGAAGGHPHNWNAISKECLSLLAELTQKLVAHHDAVASNGRAKSQSNSGSETKSWSSGTHFESVSKADDKLSTVLFCGLCSRGVWREWYVPHKSSW